jgi:hypothetical protein
MKEAPPSKKGIKMPERTLSSAEIEVGKCACETRDKVVMLDSTEEVKPLLLYDFGMDDGLFDEYQMSIQDSVELAKAREAFKSEELETTKREIDELEKKIMAGVAEFQNLNKTKDEVRIKLDETKKRMKRKESINPLEALKNVDLAKKCVGRINQLSLEFEMWVKRLQGIGRHSKVLQDPKVIRLVVDFQRLEKKLKR